jgi:Phosphotransferase enzyme family
MSAEEPLVEMTEYRLILVLPESRKILAISEVDGYHLPSISVSPRRRPAEQLRLAIRSRWNLFVFILDLLDGPCSYAVAEVLIPCQSSDLKSVSFEQVQTPELQAEQRTQIASIVAGDSNENRPLSCIGWIDSAIAWLKSETGKKLSSKRDIEQYNAGDPFALIRFRTEDGWDYWLKATGRPNAHELPITALLSKLCGDYLPEIISTKPSWNAWLMSGEGQNVTKMPTTPFLRFSLLKDVAECMARLQMKTLSQRFALLEAGAFDQGSQVFRNHAIPLFDYLEEAMSLQTSTKVPSLDKRRMRQLRSVFVEVCHRMEDVAIPETIVHGDMNCGNILIGEGRCRFIDWSEAYLGNPLITLQHLLLLNKLENSQIRHSINLLLKQSYARVWAASCDSNALEEGFLYAPILAAASTLYGRGDWLNSTTRNDPRRQSFARTLARYMDRAAREPGLLEALCH